MYPTTLYLNHSVFIPTKMYFLKIQNCFEDHKYCIIYKHVYKSVVMLGNGQSFIYFLYLFLLYFQFLLACSRFNESII